MHLTANLLGPAWCAVGFLVYIVGLGLALRAMPWYWWRRAGAASLFAGACTGVLLVWQIRIALDGGPQVHLLGATLLTLAFGWQIAMLGMSLVLVLATFAADTGLAALGVNGALSVVLAVALSYAWARLIERHLVAHVFVYVFLTAFFGAALVVAVVSGIGCAVLLVAGRASATAIAGNYLPSTVLLLFPEAFLTGAFVTLGLVYRPRWLVSFSDRRYVDGR